MHSLYFIIIMPYNAIYNTKILVELTLPLYILFVGFHIVLYVPRRQITHV